MELLLILLLLQTAGDSLDQDLDDLRAEIVTLREQFLANGEPRPGTPGRDAVNF